MLAIDRVDACELTERDARAAGHESLESVRGTLDRRRDGELYRIEFHLDGPDPRAALRDEVPDERALAEALASLSRMDRSSRRGPWTRATLRIIADRPGVRAAELAAELGREETGAFKVDVRKLKARGLTESLRTGYRLSRRGSIVLDALLQGAGG